MNHKLIWRIIDGVVNIVLITIILNMIVPGQKIIAAVLLIVLVLWNFIDGIIRQNHY
jgi:hypothetical protein